MSAEELIARFGEQHVLAFALVLARVAPLFLLAPLFSSKAFPPRVRAVTAVALAIGISPAASHALGDAAIPTGVWAMSGLLVKELLVGMAFAFGIGALFAAMQVAGTLLDTMVGFMLGGILDPLTGTQASLLAQLYSMIGVLIFIAIGGDGWVIAGLARTYEAVPLLDSPQIGSLAEGAQVAFSGIFGAAIMICAPVLLALIITDAALGVVSRVVPQINVFAVGFPAKIAVGLLLVGASLPFVAGWISDELQQSVATALRTLKVA
ncbi:MAG: flagellar biosynthetic protein FliR [Solirubrobacteraceae bacterium]